MGMPFIRACRTLPFLSSDIPALCTPTSRTPDHSGHATILSYFGGYFKTLPYLIISFNHHIRRESYDIRLLKTLIREGKRCNPHKMVFQSLDRVNVVGL